MPRTPRLPAPALHESRDGADSPGCGSALLVLIAGFGTLMCSLLVWGRFSLPSDQPGHGLWDAYVLTGLLWGAAAGIGALLMAFGLSARSARATGRRIALLDAGMALAMLWPLQAAAVAVYVATRPSVGRATRWVALTAGVLALVGGGLWGVTAYGATEIRSSTGLPHDAVGTPVCFAAGPDASCEGRLSFRRTTGPAPAAP